MTQTNQYTRDKEANKNLWYRFCKEQNLTPLCDYDKSSQVFTFIFNEGKFKGLEGKTYWTSIVRGSIMKGTSLTQESKTLFMGRIAKRLGIEFLDPYVDNRKHKHKYIVISGKYAGSTGSILFCNIENAKRVDLRSLDEKGKKYYFDKVANSRGYTVLEYPEKYQARNFCTLKSTKGNTWKVNWNSFEQDELLNCPADNMKSFGERTVAQVLEELNIPFITEYAVKTRSNKKQRIDFYIEYENKSYAIEYNGRQHYEEIKGKWGANLELQIKRDYYKREYCRTNNIRLLNIPYSIVDKDIITELVKYHLYSY